MNNFLCQIQKHQKMVKPKKMANMKGLKNRLRNCRWQVMKQKHHFSPIFWPISPFPLFHFLCFQRCVPAEKKHQRLAQFNPNTPLHDLSSSPEKAFLTRILWKRVMSQVKENMQEEKRRTVFSWGEKDVSCQRESTRFGLQLLQPHEATLTVWFRLVAASRFLGLQSPS